MADFVELGITGVDKVIDRFYERAYDKVKKQKMRRRRSQPPHGYDISDIEDESAPEISSMKHMYEPDDVDPEHTRYVDRKRDRDTTETTRTRGRIKASEDLPYVQPLTPAPMSPQASSDTSYYTGGKSGPIAGYIPFSAQYPEAIPDQYANAPEPRYTSSFLHVNRPRYRSTPRDQSTTRKDGHRRSKSRKPRGRVRLRSPPRERSQPRSFCSKVGDALDQTADGLGAGLLGAVLGGIAGREIGGDSNGGKSLRNSIFGAALGALGANLVENKYHKGKDKLHKETKAWEDRKRSGGRGRRMHDER